MANNIKIVGNILNSSTISRYSTQDTNLITSQKIQDDFGASDDYIEYYIYDVGGNLLDIDYNYNDFKLPFNSSLTPLPNTATSNTTNSIPTTDSGIVSNTNSQSGSLYPIIEIDPVQDLQNTGYTSGEFNVQYNLQYHKQMWILILFVAMTMMCSRSSPKPLPMYLYDTAGLVGTNIKGMDIDS
jgi:hypothetical protein